MYENNRIKLPISSRYVAMGCGRGLYALYEGVGFAVVCRSGNSIWHS